MVACAHTVHAVLLVPGETPITHLSQSRTAPTLPRPWVCTCAHISYRVSTLNLAVLPIFTFCLHLMDRAPLTLLLKSRPFSHISEKGVDHLG